MSNFFFQTITNYVMWSAVCKRTAASSTHAFKVAKSARMSVAAHYAAQRERC